MNVANIHPGDKIKVELSYTELLVPRGVPDTAVANYKFLKYAQIGSGKVLNSLYKLKRPPHEVERMKKLMRERIALKKHVKVGKKAEKCLIETIKKWTFEQLNNTNTITIIMTFVLTK